MPHGVNNCGWLTDGSVMVPEGSRILRWSHEEPNWKLTEDLREEVPQGISRRVISATGHHILIVAPVK